MDKTLYQLPIISELKGDELFLMGGGICLLDNVKKYLFKGNSNQFIKGDGSLDNNKYIDTTNDQIIKGQKIFGASTDSYPLVVARRSNLTESLKIGLKDKELEFRYINDEDSSTLKFILQNDDTENSNGSNASERSFELESTTNTITARLGGMFVAKKGFRHEGGKSSQFLKADGSIDSTIYLTQSSADGIYQAKGDYFTKAQGDDRYVATNKKLTTEDLDTLKKDKFTVYYADDTNTVKHGPLNNMAFTMMAYKTGDNCYTQIIDYGLVDGIYRRTYYNNNWFLWEQLITERFLPNADEMDVRSANKLTIKKITDENLIHLMFNNNAGLSVFSSEDFSNSDLPDGVRKFNLLNINGNSSDNGFQFLSNPYSRSDESKFYVRTFDNDIHSKWFRLITEDDLISLIDRITNLEELVITKNN